MRTPALKNVKNKLFKIWKLMKCSQNIRGTYSRKVAEPWLEQEVCVILTCCIRIFFTQFCSGLKTNSLPTMVAMKTIRLAATGDVENRFGTP